MTRFFCSFNFVTFFMKIALLRQSDENIVISIYNKDFNVTPMYTVQNL